MEVAANNTVSIKSPIYKTCKILNITFKTPETLRKYCIDAINFLLNPFHPPSPTKESTVETNQICTKKKPKITVLSNVIIKPAKQTSNIRLLNKVRNTEENTAFIANTYEELPKCLQGMVTIGARKMNAKK